MKKRLRVIGFGEIIWDVYPEESVIGGAMFNYCAHMAHLGDDVSMVSAVGNDDLGSRALRELERHGVGTGFVMKNSRPTGRCEVTLDENKIPRYNVLTGVSYDNIEADAGLIRRINAFGTDVFAFNTLIQRAPVSRAALVKILGSCAFPEIFCDVNIRKGCYDADSLKLCLSRATVIKISSEEGHFITDLGLADQRDGETPAEAVAERYPNIRAVVYTLGAAGSEVYDRASGVTFSSGTPEKVPVVSTVGAGDCYSATFCHEYFSGSPVPAAIAAATERSNIVVSHREAVPF